MELNRALEAAALGIFADKSNLKNFYSFLANNSHLSFFQCVQVFSVNPAVTSCRTFDEWNNEFERKIHRGSKGIPVIDEKQPYRKKYLFDVKQTYGDTAYRIHLQITDEQLLSSVKNLNLWQQETIGGYRSKLYNAVDDYCQNAFSGFEGPNQEKMLKALTAGVFSCVISKYNKPKDFIIESDFLDLNIADNIKVAAAVTEVSNNLFEAINERRNQSEKHRERTSSSAGRIQKFAANNRTVGEQQPSLFDFQSQQVRRVETPIYSAGEAGHLHQPNSAGHANGNAAAGAEGGRGIEREPISAAAQPVRAIEQPAISEAPAAGEPNRETDRRDYPGESNLQASVNYRLTKEDFADKGGQKTKFKNNIEAIKLVKELDAANRQATPAEQKILAKYVGWGGLAQAFDELNQDWQREYQELKSLLPGEEYRLAKGSVLNAHYTSKPIIDAVYAGLKQMGLENGTVLEPAMGIGNFIGLMPETFKSKIYGVELDAITGSIAKYLYPKVNVNISGFEETNFPNNYFDSVITNVPFGAYKVHDAAYDKYGLYIHNYFIVKALDKLRPGGVMAVITSKGTMDRNHAAARELFAERAELLGAIRLPNNAFKENAGTEVTADILFFQKREQPLLSASKGSWVHTGINSDGIPLNEYFLDNPDMVLGKMVKEKTLYGNEDETACIPDGRNLDEALAGAIQKLPQNIYTERKIAEGAAAANNIPADLSVKNYCFTIINDKIYLRVNEEMILHQVSSSNEARLKAMIAMRSQVRHLLEIQINNCTDNELKLEQQRLNNLYESFVKEYGILNTRTNRNLFRDDADYTLLITLENFDEAKGTVTKSDIFSKRTIRQYIRPTSADSAIEALHICKNETGKVDIKIIEDLTGKDFDQVIQELGNSIYRNPAIGNDDKYAGWETSTEYLSGNVRQKLKVAELAARDNPIYSKNVQALRQAQPEPLTASEISVRLGVTWINEDIYKQFIINKLQPGRYSEDLVEVNYNKFTGTWSVDVPANIGRGFNATNVFGTERMNGYKIVEQALNLQTPSVYDTVEVDGKETRVLNKPETIAAREKLRKIQDEFKSWIFDNPERRNRLVNVYNERFNNTKLASYDGSYLMFPEMNPLIELKPHQKDAVERIITSGNTLLHHVVGAGKTYEVAAAAMKLRQLGLAQKPMIIVPNHLVMQWAEEFRTLYPNANLLIATKKDFEKENRLKFVSRIATGDWDAVVMAMSSFEKLPISPERQQIKLNQEIDSISDALSEARKGRDNRVTVKILEKTLKNKEATLKTLLEGKKDNLIKFEDLGVDYLFVDEAHKYKNKFIFTKMNNVAGISRAMSKRATDMDMKCEYINEVHRGRKGVVFATGTPISNSMVEMYTIQSYLQRQDLAAAGLNYFDAWAANFGETQTALELAPSGQGYRSRTRFAKFTNMPELLKMYRSVADVKTADMLNLPTPAAVKHIITLKPTEEILELNKLISERAEKINNGSVPPEVDNMLKITGDGKKLALDPRCFDSAMPDNPEYKVNVCTENIYKIWEETAVQRSTQIVFCDLSTPKKAHEEYDPTKDFDVYNHVKYRLVKMGVPANEIAFVHDAETDLQKQTLFEKVRNGSIRVLIGSTEKCGAGTNVQSKLYALHHLDTPYRPSDMEQREGRIIRQGNSNKEVHIFTYVTERTFDSYSYQILENKQRFISQINKGELTVREASDIDEATLTYAEIKAITAANPLIKRKNEVENELNNFRMLEGQYKKNKYNLEDKIATFLPEAIKNTGIQISNLNSDIKMREANSGADFSITLGNKVFTERKDAGELLQALINSDKNIDLKIGVFKGFEIYPERQTRLDEKSVLLKGKGNYRVVVSDSAIGTMARLENYIKGLDERLTANTASLENHQQELKAAQIEVVKPFEHVKSIKDLTDELAKIDAQLDLNKGETPLVIDDDKFKNEVVADNADDDEPEPEDESSAAMQKAVPATKAQTAATGAAPTTAAPALKAQPASDKEQMLEVDPLRVYQETANQVLVKLPKGENSADKVQIWLEKKDILRDKEGLIIKATENCIKKGLNLKSAVSVIKRQ